MTNPRFFCLLRWRWPGAIRRQEMNSWFGVFRRASSLESGHSKGMWKPTQMCMVHLISNNFWNWKSPILERHFFKSFFFFRLLTQNSTWNVFKCVIYPTVIDNCTKTSYYRLAGIIVTQWKPLKEEPVSYVSGWVYSEWPRISIIPS